MSSNIAAFDEISHRALGFDKKENTLAAVRKANSFGVSIIELDIRMSGDGVLYVFHDAKIQGVNLEGRRFDDIRKLDADIPTLEDVLKYGNHDGYFLLDMKESSSEIANNLKEIVSRVEIPQEKLYIQNSEYRALAQFKHSLPDAKLVKLERLERNFPWIMVPSALKLVNALHDNDIEIVNMKGRSFINKEYVEVLKNSGVTVYIWTINSRDRIAFYRKIGVDGVVTDIFPQVKIPSGLSE